MTILRWGLLASWGVVAGCATTSSDFRLSAVGSDDAAIAGRILITYNGEPFNENCWATFGTSQLKLSLDGVVLFSAPKGWVSLGALQCKDGSIQHFRVRGAHFYARGNGWVNDFGDVQIIWVNDGGFKSSTMFGVVGAIVDESSDDGSVTVYVRSSSPDARRAFRRQTGVDGRWSDQPLSEPAYQNGVDKSNATTAHGFFCTNAPSRRDVNLCVRDAPGCERLRAAVPIADMTACTATASAWCYVTVGQLRCYGAREACEAHQAPSKELIDSCAEEF
jgi:hypothetical protein